MLKDLKNGDASRAAGNLELHLVQAAVAQYADYVERRGAGDAEIFSIPRLYRP